jgi:hypothetical protein
MPSAINTPMVREEVEVPPRPKLSRALRIRVWNREDGICWWCGKAVPPFGPDVEYDHKKDRDTFGAAADVEENIFPDAQAALPSGEVPGRGLAAADQGPPAAQAQAGRAGRALQAPDPAAEGPLAAEERQDPQPRLPAHPPGDSPMTTTHAGPNSPLTADAGGSAGFTPGPWEADMLDSASAEVRPVDDFSVIARVTRLDTAANARLIAAAPDMYEALQHALEIRGFVAEACTSNSYRDGPSIESCWREVEEIERLIRAALSKADSSQ